MSIDPSLILAESVQVQGIELDARRAAEIASEVDVLLAGLARVLPAVGLFDDPDGFRAALWESRGDEGRSDRGA